MNDPVISIIIPTYNRKQSLERCLTSLTFQTFRDFEVIVVDGGSDDGTRELVSEYYEKLRIQITNQTRKGLVAAENTGLGLSRGRIVIRTDDDILAGKFWLQELIQTFDLGDDIGGVTGPTIIPSDTLRHRDIFLFQNQMLNGSLVWRTIGKVYFDVFLEGKPYAIGKFYRSGANSLGSNYPICLQLATNIEVDYHEACNMAIRRNLLVDIGGFDEAYGGVAEYNEPDVSFKIREHGHKIIFNPRAWINHCPSRQGIFSQRSNSYGRVLNFIRFYFRHIKPNTSDKRLRFALYLLFINSYYVYTAVRSQQKSLFASVRGTIHGLAWYFS